MTIVGDNSVSRRDGPCGAAVGAVLLEVLVTVTLIALFMALVGGQILSAVRAAGEIDRQQRAVMLAESLVDRLEAGGFDFSDEESIGDFGDAYPGWAWKITTEQTEDENLLRLKIQVLAGQPGEDVETYSPVLTLYTFVVMPVTIDLVEDFGMSEEEAAQLADAVPIEGLDFSSVDPRMLAQMDRETLLELMPQLQRLLGQLGAASMGLGVSGALARGGAGQGQQKGGFDIYEVVRLLQQGRKQDAIELIQKYAGQQEAKGRRAGRRRPGRGGARGGSTDRPSRRGGRRRAGAASDRPTGSDLGGVGLRSSGRRGGRR